MLFFDLTNFYNKKEEIVSISLEEPEAEEPETADEEASGDENALEDDSE